MIQNVLWAEARFSRLKLPYGFTVKYYDKIGQTWVDVMSADDSYNGISLNPVFLTIEDDYHLW